MLGLVPQLGNIATGLTTIATTNQATNNISALLSPPAPPTQTAPTSYQPVLNKEYNTRFYDATKYILGYAGATSYLMQQYTASYSIFLFCRSYQYMYAGLPYNKNPKADCSEFSQKYLPTSKTFQDVSDSMVDESYESQPSSVNSTFQNTQDFAKQIQNNPSTFNGAIRGSLSDQELNQVSVYISPSMLTALYSGNLTDGSVEFSLTASSDLLMAGIPKFHVLDSNPSVVVG